MYLFQIWVRISKKCLDTCTFYTSMGACDQHPDKCLWNWLTTTHFMVLFACTMASQYISITFRTQYLPLFSLALRCLFTAKQYSLEQIERPLQSLCIGEAPFKNVLYCTIDPNKEDITIWHHSSLKMSVCHFRPWVCYLLVVSQCSCLRNPVQLV